MTTWSEGCIWCGEIMYLDDYDTGDRKADADAWCSDQRYHKQYCKVRPEDDKLRKRMLKAMEYMSLKECNEFVEKTLNIKSTTLKLPEVLGTAKVQGR